MQRRWFRLQLTAWLAALCLGSAWGADKSAVTLNFVNADIDGVVKAVSDITGRNFVIDPRVKGTVNIVSSTPVSRTLVYDVFLSALRVQGYAAVEDRGIVRIVPEAEAKLYPGPTRGPQEKPGASGDRIQTQVFTLQHESAAQLVPILRPLISPNNPISAYPGTNSLVITDYAGNLQRIEKIIQSIDQPSGTEPIIIPLRHASAVDVALTVNRLFADSTQTTVDPAQRLTVVADGRSNSLMVRSENPSRLFRLRSLVAMLDSPTSVAGNIHVVYLKNAEAVKLAETLRAIYLGDAAIAPTRAMTPLALPAMPAGAPTPGLGAPLAMPSMTPTGTSMAAGIIQADAATNSIIINAPDAIYNSLRGALEKLDVRRTQVYVEALIAEITSDKAAEFGIQWQNLSGAGANTARGFGGTNFGAAGQNILGISQNPASAGSGLNIGVIKGVVTIPGTNLQLLNLGLLVRALESDNNANILSTPTLLTLDNEEAKIVIGQNVPFVTGQYAVSGAATTPTPFQTVERKDVGLTLQIKPQVSQGGAVRLQIYSEVSSLQNTTNAAGVITNKRSVQSTVLVNDGQIVVIGGLIQDTVKDGVQKVPLLGDIPVVGGLFKYDARSRSKTNLMVFLRPTIVRDAAATDPFTTDRYDYILGEQAKVAPAPSAILPQMTSPRLPLRMSSRLPLPAPVPPAADSLPVPE